MRDADIGMHISLVLPKVGLCNWTVLTHVCWLMYYTMCLGLLAR